MQNLRIKEKVKIIVLFAVISSITASFAYLPSYMIPNIQSNSANLDGLKLNAGEISFQPEIKKIVGDFPYWVHVGDVNNDGMNDIIVANIFHDVVTILLWNTTINDWDPRFNISAGDNPMCVVIEDANNDGYNDIITCNYDANTISMLLWNGNDWESRTTKPVGVDPFRVYVGDINNDGYNDLISADQHSDSITMYLWNNLAQDWDPPDTRLVGSRPVNVFIGDANNDGYNDVIVLNRDHDSITVFLSLGSTLGSPFTLAVGDESYGLFIGDVNNDGMNDIVTTSYFDNNITILLWNPVAEYWNLGITKNVGVGPVGVSIGDVNNDGTNEIVIAIKEEDRISILTWNNFKADWDHINKAVGDNPNQVYIADANNDNVNDIVVTNYEEGSITIFLGELIPPDITIHSPISDQIFGIDAPTFSITITDGSPLDSRWYTIDGGVTNYTFSGLIGTVNQTAWNDAGIGPISLTFYANNTWGNLGSKTVNIFKEIVAPDIIIHLPLPNQEFGIYTPTFSITINNQTLLVSTWYTIDGGVTNYTFSGLIGTVNQTAWDIASQGNIVITFFAEDDTGKIGTSSVTVKKSILSEPPIPGYDVFLIFGVISLVAIILIKKIKSK